jgi:hypothetical protein
MQDLENWCKHIKLDTLQPTLKTKMVSNQNIFIKHFIYPNITAHDVQFTMDQKRSSFNWKHTKLRIKT